MSQQDDILNAILVKVINIEETVQTKMATKDDLAVLKTEMYSHIDGFIKLHETLDVELVALRSKYERLEERLIRVENKIGIAAA